MARILVLSGSTRTGSVNTRLAAVATHELKEQGADAELLDLSNYPAPIYSGDDEKADGLPVTITALKKLFFAADGLVVVSPEYNGFIPPLLINTFSWISRAQGDEQSCAVFTDKSAAIMAASPGRLGGVRVIPRLRDCLAELSVTVVPGFVTLPGALDAFDDTGVLKDSGQGDAVAGLMKKLLTRV